ncbi:hypothetical protein K505DRAFT_246135 [Melanomma pulvis-pyrius CBS 109.77]|uniref:Uncharacterized protein n=1 Tax=Melanomma pulvis-pyrius CBS 109.77 TaxID=1314802 RepID=A0A6A6X8W4_9PLEO|nr:hypothetical protein K505DRAFT_246135 [Melanomma pulvis-pyrius CBS 109.77]
MALSTRQPFAEIGSPRLQALSSAKNRQNAIAPAFSSQLKPTQSASKRRAPSVFDEDDAENVDPSIFNSPTKKSKTGDAYSKPVQFSIFTSLTKPVPSITTSPSIPSVRKALSSPRPNTSNSTPINLSRGSPKHKRIGLLSKRRTTGSPYRRVDPPVLAHSSPALPFSIDAALSGSIPNYTPKSTFATPAAATPTHASTIEESLPKGWFFEIYEDSPEQEAANLMEHSASVLDISSDDDFETKRRNEEMERGKENIPPPDFCPTQPRAQLAADSMDTTEATPTEHVKLPRLRKIAQDAMDEDRLPLGDLPAAEFYGEGLDATSYVTVDVGLEKPSSLSKEFDFSIATSEKESVQEQTPEGATPTEPLVPIVAEEQGQEQESIPIFSDESASTELPVAALEEIPVVVDAVPEAQESSNLVTP